MVRHFKKNSKLNNDTQYMAGAAPIFVYRSKKVGALLLHGFTSTAYEMKGLADYLSTQEITVYAPTIAGHGTKPQDLAKTTIADWQKSVEDAYLFLSEKVEKIYVVGSSFGGNLAFHLATKFTNPIAGVVSIGTPIKIRKQKKYKLGLYSYGWFKKYQNKPSRNYQSVYQGYEYEQVAYPVIPLSSLRRFFYFVKRITIPALSKIKIPTLIIQSDYDPVVNPKSAQYLHQRLGTNNKKIFWTNGSFHALPQDEKGLIIFKTIHRFITNGHEK